MIGRYRIRPPSSPEGVPFENAVELLDDVELVLVLGCPRSGTTFLLACLAALERTRGYSGILLPDRLCHVLACGDVPEERVEDLLYASRAALWKEFVGRLTSRRYHLANVGRRPADAGRELRVVLGREPLRLSDYRFVYKEPFMAFAAERLAGHFRAAKVIHILRDGRDCADSLDRTYPLALSDAALDAERGLWRQVGSEIGVARRHGDRIVPWWVDEGEEEAFLGASRYARYLWMWSESVRRASRCGEAHPDRFLEVRYEELCDRPGEVGREIAAFLDSEGTRAYWREIEKAHRSSIGVGGVRSCVGKGLPAFVRLMLEEKGYA